MRLWKTCRGALGLWLKELSFRHEVRNDRALILLKCKSSSTFYTCHNPKKVLLLCFVGFCPAFEQRPANMTCLVHMLKVHDTSWHISFQDPAQPTLNYLLANKSHGSFFFFLLSFQARGWPGSVGATMYIATGGKGLSRRLASTCLSRFPLSCAEGKKKAAGPKNRRF